MELHTYILEQRNVFDVLCLLIRFLLSGINIPKIIIILVVHDGGFSCGQTAINEANGQIIACCVIILLGVYGKMACDAAIKASLQVEELQFDWPSLSGEF